MKKSKVSAESSRKTIRLDKKVFFVMMIITPIFASTFSVLALMAVFQPWKNNNSPLEVPVLGSIKDTTEEKTDEKAEEKPEEKTEIVEEKKEEEQKVEQKSETSENIIKKSITKVQSKAQAAPQAKTNITTEKTTNENTPTNTEVKTEEKVEKPEEKKEEAPKKTAEEIAKETCEARTDGPKRLIKAHFFSDWEKEFYRTLGWENPAVDYDEFIFANNGNAKMVYKNNACVPSKEGMIRDETKSTILEEDQLAEYGIVVQKDFETWVNQ
jgi:hypothetical protein